MFNFFRRIQFSNIPNTKSLAFGLPQVSQVIGFLEEEEYDKIAQIYSGLSDGDKTLLLDGIGLNENTINAVIRWQRKQPDNWLANLFAGIAYTFIAWKERTGQFAKYITEAQAQGFFENLQEAIECLSEAATLKADEAEIYSRLIRVNMGLGEKKAANNCFQTLCSLAPKHIGGHMFMVNLLAPKWLGSFEEMKNFAQPFKSPSQNDVGYIVYLMFVIQQYMDLNYENERTADRIFKKTYRATVKETYAKFDMPNIPSLQRYYLHNHFAYVFYLLDENKLRNKEIDLIGQHIGLPWSDADIEGERDLKLMKFS